jgi:hypothetical protein
MSEIQGPARSGVQDDVGIVAEAEARIAGGRKTLGSPQRPEKLAHSHEVDRHDGATIVLKVKVGIDEVENVAAR